MRFYSLIVAIIFSFMFLFVTKIVLAEDVTTSISPIVNFAKVDDNYYRGGKLLPEQYLLLKNMGIKTVIDLRTHDLATFEEIKQIALSNGLKYVNIPMDSSVEPTVEKIQEFFSIINNKNNLPVYVHCKHGSDRTGIMTALYRVENYKWGFEEAFDEMLKYGYDLKDRPVLAKFLKQYILNKNIEQNKK